MKDGTREDVKWAEDGGGKYEGMELDANDEDEDMLNEMVGGKSGSVVSRRRMPWRVKAVWNLWKHRKTEKDGEAVEEDEDEEYGVRETVKQFNPREPSKEEREAREDTLACRFATGARHCVRGRGQEENLQRSQEGSRGSGGALGFHVHGR